MGLIKDELSNKNQLVKHSKFILEVSLEEERETVKIQTYPFRIISSFSQLPTELKSKRKSKEN